MDVTVEKNPSRTELLHRARGLISNFAARSAQTEQRRQVPVETIQECIEAGITRIVQPARFGGYEMDWDILCEVAMELGHGCTSQAWVAAVLAEHAWLAGLFPLEAQEDIWRLNPQALISTSFVPAGAAHSTQGGYVLNGRWPFSSGVHHAQWTIVGELLPSTAAPAALNYFLVPRGDMSIIDDWQTFGMIGTGSCSVELRQVFVPSHRVLSAHRISEGTSPGASLSSAPIYRMPLSGFAPTALASILVGGAEAMIEHFTASLVAKSRSVGKAQPTDLALARISESSAEASAARLLVIEGTRTIMAKLRRGERLTDSDAQTAARDSGYAAILCLRAARRIFDGAGSRAIYHANALQRFYRDIAAAASHAAFSWERISTAYGRSVLKLAAGRSGT